MNKSAIKNFAVNARKKLIEDVVQKAFEVGIEGTDNIQEIEIFEGGFKVKGRENAKVFNKYQLKQREELVKKVKEKGLEQVAEEVAYTWFNRIIAIRFMEVNEYLPTGVRVLSSAQDGKIEPDIIAEALNIDLDIDREVVYRLQDNHDSEELFKYLLVKQCNKLKDILPKMFEKIEDYTELLLPDNLLKEDSVIRDLVKSIDEEDFREQVEIIGWLYQYYISEKKDEVFAGLKKNKKITKENIPAATQLFTPKWIVKYMVENSLGRLWQESHPDEDLKANWKYYIEEAEQEPEVKVKLDELVNKDLNPEEITFLDPSMGSGHILVYAFDVLYEIYLKAGYSEREIPKLILEKNLYGLDIDDRAGQLAYFALMMKARSKSRRIFRNTVNVNVCSIQESNGISKQAIDFLVNSKETELEKKLHREYIQYLLDTFKDAKEYGSILEVKEVDFDVIEKRVEQIRNDLDLDLLEREYKQIILEKFLPIIEQAKIMSEKYDVVVTNPPYMGQKHMNPILREFLKVRFPLSKNDLFSAFIEDGFCFLKNNGILSMVTMQSWMFLQSFVDLRDIILGNKTVFSLNHLGNNVMGIAFGTCAFSIRNRKINAYKGTYNHITVENLNKQGEPIEFPVKNSKFKQIDIEKLKNIPNSPFAYWISEGLLKSFLSKNVSDYAFSDGQNLTGNNEKYLRLFWEVNCKYIGIHKRWVLHSKGGDSRKWSGNIDTIIDWSENARNHYKNDKIARIAPEYLWYREGITWLGSTSSDNFGVRYLPQNTTYNKASPTIFVNQKTKLKYIIGFLNTKIVKELILMMNPTMYTSIADMLNLPIIEGKLEKTHEVNRITDICIDISEQDWNLFETSWDFKIHPLLKHLDLGSGIKLSNVFNIWETETEEAFNQLKFNEEELNRIFIDIYGLQDELTPEVGDKDITISKSDRERDIKSFISYAVGCMLGRYSLDKEGLIYAGGEFDISRYSKFNPTESNVIPIVDDEYFEDDITNRFVEFVKVTFGKETLNENLKYIAETLGIKNGEMPKDTVRRYFIKDFYKDHNKTYKKRPIYWLVDSGKQNGFKALIYMHRYNESTVAKVRTDYLHVLQKKYEAEMKRLDLIIESDLTQREKTAATKKIEKIRKQQRECMEYDQVIAHVANQRIPIDLDDGVKVNYMKFQDVEIPQGEDKKPLKANLLSKIKL